VTRPRIIQRIARPDARKSVSETDYRRPPSDEDAFYDLVIGIVEGRVSKAAVNVFLEERGAKR
jgi:hypothetical protein